MSEHHVLTTETLVAVLLLIIFIICGPIFEKIHFHYMHESGLVMILGILVAAFMNYIDPSTSFAKTLKFDSEVFFNLILPPIIFAAGYNLRKKFFFKYLLYILLFGVIGTVINFLLVAPFTMIVNTNYGFQLSSKEDIFDERGRLKKSESNGHGDNQNHHRNLEYDIRRLENVEKTESQSHEHLMVISTKEEPTNNHSSENKVIATSNKILEVITFDTNEILLFASVISATDAVAALAFVKEDSDPKLFPILFGEGVVNDAVCIVLYQIIKAFLESGDSKFLK